MTPGTEAVRLHRGPGSAPIIAAIGAILGIAIAACGSAPSTPPPPWRATHPDPAGAHFSDAGFLCALAVQYPNDAPGEIDYAGAVYIQRGRSSTAPHAPGRVVGRSTDWTLYEPATGTLLLDTASAWFTYRSSTGCATPKPT